MATVAFWTLIGLSMTIWYGMLMSDYFWPPVNPVRVVHDVPGFRFIHETRQP